LYEKENVKSHEKLCYSLADTKKEPDTWRSRQDGFEIDWDLPEPDIGRRVDISVACGVAC